MSLIRVTRGVPKYNIQIGPLDQAFNHNPTAILSVTDTYDERVMQFPHFQWVPILETGKSWGYRPFYAAKRILDFWCMEMQLPLVYLCCSAGVHRSPMTAFCWLLSLGANMTPESVNEEFYGHFKNDLTVIYKRDIEKGYIPGDLPAFYKLMREQPTWSYGGILQGMLKYERISYITDSEVIKGVR
jgi:hypothetical protein